MVSFVVLIGYVLISRSAIHLYPFSIFDMYSERLISDSGSRILARDAKGGVTEVDRYRAWACPAPIDLRDECARKGAYYIPYKDEETVRWIEAHRGDGAAGAPVALVRRVFWLYRDAPTRVEDCVIAECRAVPQ